MDFTIPDQATAAAIILGSLSLLGLLIRQIGPWRKQVVEEEAEFRATLRAENDILRERIDNVERILRRKEARHTAERSLDQHKIRNLTACFDAAMLMLEMNPDRGADVAAKIKEMRASQMVAEAQEAAIIRAAAITDDERDDMEHEEQIADVG
jgi:hypothetical protein